MGVSFPNKPLVSVIIPVYKVENYLEKSVLSVVNQDYENFEVILVDDGSPDRCPEICDRLGQTYKMIKVIHQTNKGLSGARNAGIQYISEHSEYVLFLDSDDILYRDAITNMLCIAEKNHSDMVIPDRYTQVDEETGKETLRFHFEKSCYYHDPIDYALEVILGQGRGARSHSLLYRTSCIVENNVRFPEGYTTEDVVFNLRLFPHLTRIDFYDKPTVYYLKRKGSITTSFNERYMDIIYYIDEQATAFLDNIGKGNDTYAVMKRESLLCRNILAYVKKSLSSKNPAPKNEKKTFALNILKDPRLDGVFKRKHTIPYFQTPKGRVYYRLMYFLLRLDQYKLAISIASLFC